MKVLEMYNKECKLNKNGKVISKKCKSIKDPYFDQIPIILRGVGALLLEEGFITEGDVNRAVLFEPQEVGAKNLYKLITKRLKKDLDRFVK